MILLFRTHLTLFATICLVALTISPSASAQKTSTQLKWENNKFELNDGDRVLFLGNTFIEREQRSGYIETRLNLCYPTKNIVFRNLGWSGDNVFGDSRARFGNRAEGYNHLLKSLELVKPTVVFVSYGSNAAYQGKPGLAEFETGYHKLLDSLEKYTAKVVMLSPTPLENLGAPLPDPTAQNERLAIYRDSVKDIAYKRGYLFVDLYDQLGSKLQRHTSGNSFLTDNGMHLTDYGYWEASFPIAAISQKEAAAKIAVPKHGKADEGAVQKLRETIVAKNELFFHRYRPQNETYLYLFRKHEQGNNAAEIPLFDPLIAAKEKEIFELKQKISTN